jgi:hypothetical protein
MAGLDELIEETKLKHGIYWLYHYVWMRVDLHHDISLTYDFRKFLLTNVSIWGLSNDQRLQLLLFAEKKICNYWNRYELPVENGTIAALIARHKKLEMLLSQL